MKKLNKNINPLHYKTRDDFILACMPIMRKEYGNEMLALEKCSLIWEEIKNL